MKAVAPHGSWESPISTALIGQGAVGLQLVDLDGDRVVWTELRPHQGGRMAVLESGHDGGGRRELGPAGLNARSLVHEYGGGAVRAQQGWRVVVSYPDQQIWVLEAPGLTTPRSLGRPGERHADLDLSPGAGFLASVCERPRQTGEHQNLLEILPTSGLAPIIIDEEHDFFGSPSFSPDGRQLAYLSWDHPSMPWDSSTLWLVEWDGVAAGRPRRVAGGEGESIFQPGWSPRGRLTFASDRSGFWNIYQARPDGELRPLTPAAMDFGRPLWTLGQSIYAYLDEHHLVACGTDQGIDRLFLVDLEAGQLRRELAPDLVSIDGVRAGAGKVAVVGGRTDRPSALLVLDLESGRRHQIARTINVDLSPSDVSVPEPLGFDTSDGAVAHAFFYPPCSSRFEGPPGEKPPLIVHCHGGPTASAGAALRLLNQFWTSRGLAVVDVNYRGSSGYGRAYRRALEGRWGELDLIDCRGAARALVEAGRVDGQRLAIRGGSAGGFTALAAAVFCDDFAAAASHYGIGDLESLARDTHKFESHYLEGLLGPLPAARALYRQRSPLFNLERLRTPLLILQGLQDKVVPPDQAERMVAALQRAGVTHAYVTFPDESHGFRRGENIERALLAELAFYGHVFGFQPADAGDLEIWGAARQV